MRYQRVRPL